MSPAYYINSDSRHAEDALSFLNNRSSDFRRVCAPFPAKATENAFNLILRLHYISKFVDCQAFFMTFLCVHGFFKDLFGKKTVLWSILGKVRFFYTFGTLRGTLSLQFGYLFCYKIEYLHCVRYIDLFVFIHVCGKKFFIRQ